MLNTLNYTQKDNENMEQEIQNIIEKEKIIEVINLIFIGTDNRDWKMVKNCFADRVLFDMTSIAGGKPEELPAEQIIDGWDKGLKDLQYIQHHAGNYIVNINNNIADVFCYGTAYHYLENPSGRNTRTFVGSYNFQLRRIEDKWKINMFKFNLKFIDGNKNLTD